MLFTLCAIFLYETGPIQWMFSQHCGYWWPGALAPDIITILSNISKLIIKWKHFPPYWPFVWEIHRSPVNSPHKEGQWRGALMFSLICVWINSLVNNREAADLRCYCTHYDVTVMMNGSKGAREGKPAIWTEMRGDNCVVVLIHWPLGDVVLLKIFKHTLRIKFVSISCENALSEYHRMPLMMT